jgi:hypothetical protein
MSAKARDPLRRAPVRLGREVIAFELRSGEYALDEISSQLE